MFVNAKCVNRLDVVQLKEPIRPTVLRMFIFLECSDAVASACTTWILHSSSSSAVHNWVHNGNFVNIMSHGCIGDGIVLVSFWFGLQLMKCYWKVRIKLAECSLMTMTRWWRQRSRWSVVRVGSCTSSWSIISVECRSVISLDLYCLYTLSMIHCFLYGW